VSLVKRVAASYTQKTAYGSLEDIHSDITRVYNQFVDMRAELSKTLQKLQQDDKQLLAAKTQKLMQSIEDTMSQMQTSFPHLVTFF